MATKPMRSCAPTEEHPMRFPRYVSVKLDGIRAVKHGGKALTKSMKAVRNKHIAGWIAANLFDGADGEVISGPPNIESVYDTTYKAVMTGAGEPDFCIYLFDLHDQPGMVARDRYDLLRQKVLALPLEAQKFVTIAAKILVHSQEEFDEQYACALDSGYEGLVSQDPEGPYVHGKTTPKSGIQLKHKPHDDAEFVILGCYEAQKNNNEKFTNEVGESKRSTHQENLEGNGMLGGFHARDLLTGVEFNVGPGKMPHAERITVWQQWLADPASLIGRMGKYRAMSYGTMANGRPRHGRFYGWRDATDM